MRKQSIRRTTLLSLIGLKPSSAQSDPSWNGQLALDSPSTTALLSPNPSLGSAASSTETLVPTSPAAAATPDLTLVSGTRTSSHLSAATFPTTNFSFTVSLESPTGTGMTVSTPISQSVTLVQGSSGSTGGAAPTVFARMGFAGALAGAAGVLMV